MQRQLLTLCECVWFAQFGGVPNLFGKTWTFSVCMSANSIVFGDCMGHREWTLDILQINNTWTPTLT